MDPTTQTPSVERPPIMAYERMGEARETCLICLQTREIPRFRLVVNGVRSSATVVAQMCPHCHNRFTHGLLPVHPWWFRTPKDGAKRGDNR